MKQFLGLLLLASCATSEYTADEDHRVATETAVAIKANVPRDIARARERGQAAVEKERQRSQRWLLGTKRCCVEDRAMLNKTLLECLEYRGTYADAKRQFRRERWAYIGALTCAPSCVPTQ